MDRRRFLRAVGTAGLIGVAGCASVASTGEYDVGMTATAFDPPEITVSVGESVTWRNTSSRGHTVTAYEESLPEGAAFFASGDFDSESAARDGFSGDLEGSLSNADTFTHTFEVPGTYPYFCIPHEQAGMVGTVVVEGEQQQQEE